MIVNFITTFITTIIIVFAVILILIKLLGWNMFSVDSASMSPQYQTDTLVIVQPADPDEIEVGDVITYVFNEDGVLVTHRVVDINKERKTFTTKGDANNSEDPIPVLWSNLVGKVTFSIPKLGKPLRFLTNPDNRYVVIGFIVMIFIVSLGWDILKRRKNDFTGKEKQHDKE